MNYLEESESIPHWVQKPPHLVTEVPWGLDSITRICKIKSSNETRHGGTDRSPWVWGQPGQHSEFQDSQGLRKQITMWSAPWILEISWLTFKSGKLGETLMPVFCRKPNWFNCSLSLSRGLVVEFQPSISKEGTLTSSRHQPFWLPPKKIKEPCAHSSLPRVIAPIPGSGQKVPVPCSPRNTTFWLRT